jgi:hypothetical protein
MSDRFGSACFQLPESANALLQLFTNFSAAEFMQ